LTKYDVIIAGAGFTGLSAALELLDLGLKPIIIEPDTQPGGLAGCFEVNGTQLEKFYHHWFKSDEYIHELASRIGRSEDIIYRSTKTGSYFANSIFRLSKPWDLLGYTPLSMLGRFRLGLLVLQAKSVKDWRTIEKLSAEQWLRSNCGDEVYEKVWKPLLKGKFGDFAPEIGAVWMWNKLALRGGSRDKSGGEVLAYFKGGFAELSRRMAKEIEARGGRIELGNRVRGINLEENRFIGVETDKGARSADAMLATMPQPVFQQLVKGHVDPGYYEQLGEIDFLGNVCMVLELDRSLSDTYWMNVSDPGFPFVGVIEHTNFEPPASYGGSHIVYLSKYLPTDTDMFGYDRDEMLSFAVPYLSKMFPEFERSWVKDAHLFKSEFTQPIVRPGYSDLIPSLRTPIDGVYLSTMSQIYPEDRGTNYAVRQGLEAAKAISKDLEKVKFEAVQAGR